MAGGFHVSQDTPTLNSNCTEEAGQGHTTQSFATQCVNNLSIGQVEPHESLRFHKPPCLHATNTQQPPSHHVILCPRFLPIESNVPDLVIEPLLRKKARVVAEARVAAAKAHRSRFF